MRNGHAESKGTVASCETPDCELSAIQVQGPFNVAVIAPRDEPCGMALGGMATCCNAGFPGPTLSGYA